MKPLDEKPEINPQLSNDELQTAINVIIASKLIFLNDKLLELISEQVRRSKLWIAKGEK